MLAAVRSATVFGVEGRVVTVEVHVSNGLPAFQIVGLPDEACRESRDRVRAAIVNFRTTSADLPVLVSAVREIGASLPRP